VTAVPTAALTGINVYPDDFGRRHVTQNLLEIIRHKQGVIVPALIGLYTINQPEFGVYVAEELRKQ
jgi:hypothetical protein